MIIVLGLVLRVNNLSGRSLWTDEFFTLFESSGHGVDIEKFLGSISKKDAPPLLRSGDFKPFISSDPAKNINDVSEGLLVTDTHPPLYFWIMHFWMRLFGDGVFALRFFSVLAGALAIILAYLAGRHLFDRRAAVFCALFCAISAFSVRYSQEARVYSLVMAIGFLSSLFLLRLEENNRGRDAFYFAVSSALGLYAHYFYSFVIIGQFVYFSVVYRRESVRLRKFYLAAISSLLFFSPWFIQVILKGYNFRNAEWVFGFPGIINKAADIFRGMGQYLFISDIPGVAPKVLLLAGFSFFIYLAVCGTKEALAHYRRQFFFCLSIFLTPLLAMLFLDIIQHGALLRQERFWMFSFLGFVPLAGYFLDYGFSRHKAFGALLVILMLASSVFVGRVQFGPAPEYAGSWINKESRGAPAAVIVYNIRSVVFAQSYYLDGDIYLLPVSSVHQLDSAVKESSAKVKKIFIVRHYHRTDHSLMNQLFMETEDIGEGFKLKDKVNKDDISISEFVNAHYKR